MLAFFYYSIFAADNGHYREIYGLSLFGFQNGEKKTNDGCWVIYCQQSLLAFISKNFLLNPQLN